ncbi:MAG: hypothetical protein DRO67_02825 [Candidatus Asgardarchaeum californiense]|nr:MAG: hypothetical protein DRO67_02825 [Candidatus Asgardarchaeum californiense]
MIKENLSEYKKKYALWRHHAWAGSILLSVLLALRIIIGEEYIHNEIVFVVGIILVFYVLISLFFTYKYREGLRAEKEENVIHVKSSSDEVEKARINAEVEKERLKLEKKKVKAEAKRAKKQNKK